MITTLLTGLAAGSLIFVVSSGLTLVLGVLRIVNFAHGGLFLIGAYFAYQFQGGAAHNPASFALLVVAAGLATAVIGVLVERFLLRPFYDHSAESMLLATYAVLLTMQGAVQMIWGSSQHTQPRPEGLGGALTLGDTVIPRYDLMLIVVGLLIFGGLQWLIYGTGFGRQVIAVAEDRYMASLLGIDISRIFMATFAVAIFLAGVGGALAAPTLSMTPNLATTFILYSFAVVIIGGFGSISGSLIASLLLGVLASFLGTHAPELADFALYLPMLLILFFRPEGLRGRGAGREVVIA
ncbi:branched-chain amino acid ABC transporter permease [Nocardioides sp. LMS-CY]|uniref:Branched-subunit amino acid ABC-type transport system permease component n=1 Tax=Nocardioides soli TaxID=1036020 RepID=A0A7W4VU39_9ACTN|nr:MULTISPECIES: branched-chain amino acid ABC transporter permease [Nocardioides]MBB3041813.1 branched-subunit amino acid ABC-type transport system permease component [Nocardioides soli]QWF21325.1 branched-chain amino acid ABC transporter permease [Nocardioides sp. LMS-CY]